MKQYKDDINEIIEEGHREQREQEQRDDKRVVELKRSDSKVMKFLKKTQSQDAKLVERRNTNNEEEGLQKSNINESL